MTSDYDMPEEEGYCFEELCLPHYDALMSFALRLCGGNKYDAQDIVQTSFYKGMRAWHRWSPEGDPRDAARSWLFKIVSNTYISAYQRQHVRAKALSFYAQDLTDVLYGEAQAALCDATTHVSEAERRVANALGVHGSTGLGDELTAAISKLSAPHQEVIERHYIRGQSYQRIASDLGIPKDTVATRLSRARDALVPLIGQFAANEYGYRRRVS